MGHLEKQNFLHALVRRKNCMQQKWNLRRILHCCKRETKKSQSYFIIQIALQNQQMYVNERLMAATLITGKIYMLSKAWFKRRILHAPNQILILVDSNEYVRLI